MRTYPFAHRAARLAVGAAVLAAGIASWSVREMIAPRRDGPAERSAATELRTVSLAPRDTSMALLEEAVEVNPFRPERQPAVAGLGVDSSRRDPVAPPPLLHLLGTVLDGEGSFAVCQLGDASPRVVHVGERIGSHRLQTVTQGAAVVVDADGSPLTLRVPTLARGRGEAGPP